MTSRDVIEPIATGLFNLAIGRALWGFRGDFKSVSVLRHWPERGFPFHWISSLRFGLTEFYRVWAYNPNQRFDQGFR